MSEEATKDWLKNFSSNKNETISKATKKSAYSSKDLDGIRVEDDFDRLATGQTEVLVAKDIDIMMPDGNDHDENAVCLTTLQKAGTAARGKVALSFDDEGDEPQFYYLGSQTAVRPKEKESETSDAKFDTTNSTTIENVVMNESKRRRATRKKTTVSSFTEDPLYKPEQSTQIEEDRGIEDDSEIALALAQNRKKNLEHLQRIIYQADHSDHSMDEDSKKEDSGEPVGITLISGVSDFLESVKRPERLAVKKNPQTNTTSEAVPCDVKTELLDKTTADTSNTEIDSSFIDEPLVSKGVAATLAFLKGRGAGLEINTGREPFNFEKIEIVHRDEFGNVVSAKEAYKILSHHFHGNKSGKNKQEKRLKKKSQQSAAKVVLSGENEVVPKTFREQAKSSETAIDKKRPGKPSQKASTASATKKPKIFGMQ